MFKIPTILTSDELIDKAYKRGTKLKTIKEKDKIYRARKISINKINIINSVIGSTLSKYITRFPSFDSLPRFYYELIDILIGIDPLKKSLGAIDWCRHEVSKVSRLTISKLKFTSDLDEITQLRNGAYGRVASIVKQVSKNLELLGDAKNVLKRLPEIDPELPTVVIAGYPNTGKSLLVKQISTANPKIARYPFTTQTVSIGYFERRHQKYQVIDTPGLLDRDITEQNPIEQQATSALKHLADLIVYMLDPSEYCGYQLELQLNLLSRLENLFGDEVPIVVVENKVDLKRLENDRLKISAETGEGIEALIEQILQRIEQSMEEDKVESEED